MAIKIDTYRVETGCGQVSTYFGHPLKNILSEDERKKLDEIGYTGKLNGVRTSRTEYLNTLNKGTWSIEQTKRDSGDFSEAFIFIRAYNV